MSLYKQAGCQFWWFQIYGPDRTRIRMSTGSADKDAVSRDTVQFTDARGVGSVVPFVSRKLNVMR